MVRYGPAGRHERIFEPPVFCASESHRTQSDCGRLGRYRLVGDLDDQGSAQTAEALSEATASSNPEGDKNVEEKRKALRTVLGEVTKNAHTVFADGWGLAVMYVLADRKPTATM